MFREYDVVQLACDLAPNLPKGTTGTIVMVHDAKAGAYEVELFDNDHNTLAVKTLEYWQLAPRDDAA